ncbi:hypothetical protein XINFAN_02404 [Pseudogemmobacter humi]|uniref:Uncharacterized protein n=1 Tax=Pseudogemmobacter humi TaxID=2483812 RepID=A0A3P5X6U3_9RHOB|nr:hypothetical protein XINFAN_02404 [Pseudogemmobacter humi]
MCRAESAGPGRDAGERLFEKGNRTGKYTASLWLDVLKTQDRHIRVFRQNRASREVGLANGRGCFPGRTIPAGRHTFRGRTSLAASAGQAQRGRLCLADPGKGLPFCPGPSRMGLRSSMPAARLRSCRMFRRAMEARFSAPVPRLPAWQNPETGPQPPGEPLPGKTPWPVFGRALTSCRNLSLRIARKGHDRRRPRRHPEPYPAPGLCQGRCGTVRRIGR